MSGNHGAWGSAGTSDPTRVRGPFDVETPQLSPEQRARLRRESDALRNTVTLVQAGESAMQARLMSQISPHAIRDESGSEGESTAKAMVKTRVEQEVTEAQQQQQQQYQEPQQDQTSEEVSVTSDSEDYESFSNEEKSKGSGSGSGSGGEETGGQESSNERAAGSDVDDSDDHKRQRASSQ
ncbi:uncharacterized protein CLUP02_15723 [Colletotrichum lupini]|uniref:Uncharacterized protein n=1 Tax=Colletotrichum lupini TaxID=145971 RepID=A0A9Q8T6M0_9PEZI|nr:uncharacterized protein CLUP02_15723 [Colletotrichum lupini]UQC90193.1 hypothetical protein CLUP02_15723 [Colletotrichum lupini]